MDLLAIVNWIATNWVLVVALVFGLVVLITTLLDYLKINNDLRELFLMAEKYLAAQVIANGPEAMELVVLSLYAMLPGRVQAVLKLIAGASGTTEKAILQKFAQWVYDRVHEKYARRPLPGGNPLPFLLERR